MVSRVIDLLVDASWTEELETVLLKAVNYFVEGMGSS